MPGRCGLVRGHYRRRTGRKPTLTARRSTKEGGKRQRPKRRRMRRSAAYSPATDPSRMRSGSSGIGDRRSTATISKANVPVVGYVHRVRAVVPPCGSHLGCLALHAVTGQLSPSTRSRAPVVLPASPQAWRTAVRNPTRGRVLDGGDALTGHKTEQVFRRCDIMSNRHLKNAVELLDTFKDVQRRTEIRLTAPRPKRLSSWNSRAPGWWNWQTQGT